MEGLPERRPYHRCFEDHNGIVHLGEACIRLDGESDWPWMDCHASSSFMYWVAKPPSCFWCIAGLERSEGLRGPWPPTRDPWVSA